MGGTIADPASNVVVNATVSIMNEETGSERITATNDLGYYTIPALPPGSYQIQVRAPGFETATRAGIRLQVGDALRLDIGLSVAGQATSVDVSEQFGVLATENAGLGQVIGRREIADLPLNQRHFLSFALLAPGVTPPTYGSAGAKLGGAIHVNGGREQSNQFLLDGIDNSDPRLHQVSLAPPIEAIDQFKVQSSNASADFGRLAAGQIDMALKSGTNALHGSLFEFVRNRHMDARNFFDGLHASRTHFQTNVLTSLHWTEINSAAAWAVRWLEIVPFTSLPMRGCSCGKRRRSNQPFHR